MLFSPPNNNSSSQAQNPKSKFIPRRCDLTHSRRVQQDVKSQQITAPCATGIVSGQSPIRSFRITQFLSYVTTVFVFVFVFFVFFFSPPTRIHTRVVRGIEYGEWFGDQCASSCQRATGNKGEVFAVRIFFSSLELDYCIPRGVAQWSSEGVGLSSRGDNNCRVCMMRGIARASGEERPAPSDCTSPHPACVYKYMHVQHRHQDPSSQFPLREFALHRSLRERERERRRDAAKPSPAKSVSCFLFGCGLIDLNLCLTHSTCNVLLLFFDS